MATWAVGCSQHPNGETTRVTAAPDSSASPTPRALGRLAARPGPPTALEQTRFRRLGLGNERDGLLYVGAGYRAGQLAPLVMLLHGAGGSAQGALSLLHDRADAAGLVLLAPDSRAATWDVIADEFGPDIAFMDRALAQVFGDFSIDPTQLAIGGFSDGASYALSVGLMNGDLFSHIIAFSPGFFAPASRTGAPRIFVAHGTRDEILPIDTTSRVIVPQLQRAGYDVTYREFDGPHDVPKDMRDAALEWFLPPM